MMKYRLLACLFPLMLLGCRSGDKQTKHDHNNTAASSNGADVIAVSEFDGFLQKFNSDSAFQMAHVKFPLKVVFGDDVKIDSIHYLPRNDWKYTKFKSTGPNIFEIKRLSETRVDMVYALEDSGMHINYYFDFVNKDWMLTYVKDDSD